MYSLLGNKTKTVDLKPLCLLNVPALNGCTAQIIIVNAILSKPWAKMLAAIILHSCTYWSNRRFGKPITFHHSPNINRVNDSNATVN